MRNSWEDEEELACEQQFLAVSETSRLHAREEAGGRQLRALLQDDLEIGTEQLVSTHSVPVSAYSDAAAAAEWALEPVGPTGLAVQHPQQPELNGSLALAAASPPASPPAMPPPPSLRDASHSEAASVESKRRTSRPLASDGLHVGLNEDFISSESSLLDVQSHPPNTGAPGPAASRLQPHEPLGGRASSMGPAQDLMAQFQDLQQHFAIMQRQLQLTEQQLAVRARELDMVTAQRDSLLQRLEDGTGGGAGGDAPAEARERHLEKLLQISKMEMAASSHRMEAQAKHMQGLLERCRAERDDALDRGERILQDLTGLHECYKESQADNHRMAALLATAKQAKGEHDCVIDTLEAENAALRRDNAALNQEIRLAWQSAGVVSGGPAASDVSTTLSSGLERLEVAKREASVDVPDGPLAAQGYVGAYRRPQPELPWSQMGSLDPPAATLHTVAHGAPGNHQAGSHRESAPAGALQHSAVHSPEKSSFSGSQAAKPINSSSVSGTISNSKLSELESQLLAFNTERDQVEAEYAKMPLHSGRTLSQRQRKTELEGRMADLDKQISRIRLALRRHGYR